MRIYNLLCPGCTPGVSPCSFTILRHNLANPSAYNEVARFYALNAKTWNTPALGGEFLLVRNDQEAACFRLPTRLLHVEISPAPKGRERQ